MKLSLALTLMLTFACAQAMERTPKMIKVTDIAAVEPTEQLSECDMLMDAYRNRTGSKFYKSNRIIIHKPYDLGTDDLERALYRHDIQECINLVAEGHPIDKPEPHNWRAIHTAAQEGMYSFCEFLIQLKVDISSSINDIHDTTPLRIAADGGHGKICKLLLEHGAQVAKIPRHNNWIIFNLLTRCQDITLTELAATTAILAKQRTMEDQTANRLTSTGANESIIFDNLALNSTPERFSQLLPLLIELGADLETPDEDGRRPLHRFLYPSERCTHALITIITAYHAFLERQELKAAFTALAIRKCRKDSLLALLPKDVLKSCVLKFVVPFRIKHLDECVNQQLALMQRLLAREASNKDTQSTPEPIWASSYQNEQSLFADHNVEQHRAMLTATTRKLMYPNAYQMTKEHNE